MSTAADDPVFQSDFLPKHAPAENGRTSHRSVDEQTAVVFGQIVRRIEAYRDFAEPNSPSDIPALQLLWWHHVATGCARSGDLVLAALERSCRSALGDASDQSVRDLGDAQPSAHSRKTLRDNAIMLELLTWVRRVRRHDNLQRVAEGIAQRTVREMIIAEAGFASHADGSETVRADWNGLMLVALLEAGSVFERRDWLASTMKAFDVLVGRLTSGSVLHHQWSGGNLGPPADAQDYAAIARAALRLHQAFGRPRYLEQAEAWVAVLDAKFWTKEGGYRATPTRADPAIVDDERDDCAIAGNAMMIGVLDRLHQVTGRSSFGERATRLADLLGSQADIADAAILAALASHATRVTIDVSGVPGDAETRALMRAALDYGLPDRVVLGPGAGKRPRDRAPAAAEITIGTARIAPMRLEALRRFCAPGGLASAVL